MIGTERETQRQEIRRNKQTDRRMGVQTDEQTDRLAANERTKRLRLRGIRERDKVRYKHTLILTDRKL
jgi:hypothetical protein